MERKAKSLKELYEKDFYLWVQENLRLLKNKEYDLVDWENLLEESKVLWELVLTALKHELISTSYASDVLEISPMEIEEARTGLTGAGSFSE
jgi:hypothetical protein